MATSSPPEARKAPRFDPRNSPVYWFALMEAAGARYDFQRAADAKRELERLGFTVSYRRPSPVGGPDNAA